MVPDVLASVAVVSIIYVKFIVIKTQYKTSLLHSISFVLKNLALKLNSQSFLSNLVKGNILI